MTSKKKLFSRKWFQLISVILLTVAFTFIYFPSLLEGKKINASDMNHWRGMSKEITDFRDDTGIEPLWTNSQFGGMAAYLISAKYNGNIISKINSFYYNHIPRPANYLIYFILFFFIFLYMLEVNIWISLIGALAFALNTTFFVWIDTGHMTKAQTLTYLALVILGIMYAYRKNAIKGSITAGIGLSLMLLPNHPQMTYYAGIMVIFIAITYLIFAIKEKTVAKFLKTSALLLVAAVLGLGTNFARLYTTLEYGEYSMRGESELTKDGNSSTGLDKSYILDYSYDFGEAMTAFIPRFKGGGMAEKLGENSAFYQELEKTQGKQRASQIAENAPLYWGSQPISMAPFYFGAVLCFLFILGLFLVKGKDRWWILVTVIVAFLLSLGKYLPGLAHFMIDYFPGYNKFRDVKNIIVIQHFAMALMGVLAIKEVYDRKIDNKTFLRGLKWAFGITGGFALVFVLIPSLAGDFVGPSDARYAQAGWPQSLIDAIQSDRKSILRADAFRTFAFVALAAAGIWAYWTKKIKGQYAIILWAVLVIGDMWPINKKYLNDSDFVSKRKAEAPYTATKADQAILADKSLDYRVLNMSVNPWSDASTSYFHKSIGGYHGAKMQRYQEMIENHLSPEMQEIGSRLRTVKSQADVDAIFYDLNALNMLNTKYVIYNAEAAPLQNTSAMGNAWFVNHTQIVADANEEIDAIDELDIQNTAVIDQRFKEHLPASIKNDSTASIKLLTYAPNKLVYQSITSEDQLAVFSEIYYPKGWIATIDGKEQVHFRANYILRSMVVPAGEHEIIFEFKPKSYEIGNKISFASSLILLLAALGVVYIEIKKKRTLQTNEE